MKLKTIKAKLATWLGSQNSATSREAHPYERKSLPGKKSQAEHIVHSVRSEKVAIPTSPNDNNGVDATIFAVAIDSLRRLW